MIVLLCLNLGCTNKQTKKTEEVTKKVANHQLEVLTDT